MRGRGSTRHRACRQRPARSNGSCRGSVRATARSHYRRGLARSEPFLPTAVEPRKAMQGARTHRPVTCDAFTWARRRGRASSPIRTNTSCRNLTARAAERRLNPDSSSTRGITVHPHNRNGRKACRNAPFGGVSSSRAARRFPSSPIDVPGAACYSHMLPQRCSRHSHHR